MRARILDILGGWSSFPSDHAVLFGALVSGSVAVTVYTTVLVAAFSATLLVAPLVMPGASFTSVTLIVTAFVSVSVPVPASVAITLIA